jgi:exopolysaccharide biosynthesis protein
LAVKALNMDDAVFLDGGGSSEMILEGADGRHRRIDDAYEGERPMHTTIVLTEKA